MTFRIPPLLYSKGASPPRALPEAKCSISLPGIFYFNPRGLRPLELPLWRWPGSRCALCHSPTPRKPNVPFRFRAFYFNPRGLRPCFLLLYLFPVHFATIKSAGDGIVFRSLHEKRKNAIRQNRMALGVMGISQRWSPWRLHTDSGWSHRRWRTDSRPGKRDLPHRPGWKWPCIR